MVVNRDKIWKWTKSSSMTFLVYCLFLVIKQVNCDKIEEKIYKSIKNIGPCILLTNSTHQIGCTSSFNGNKGILHFIENIKDVDWLIDKGKHSPYVPLLTPDLFNEEQYSGRSSANGSDIVTRLIESKKVSGILVINSDIYQQSPADGFSPDHECPLDSFGLYKNDSTYGNCKKVSWNKKGNSMSLKYYGLPIFALTNTAEVLDIIQCYYNHNVEKDGLSPSYPLCGIELKDFMFAAKDTPTCRRKTEIPNLTQYTYCDPLGDWNVWGTLMPMYKPLKPEEVVMATVRLDSTGFFHDLAPGADNDVTGIVTLLAAAYALGDLKRKNESAMPPRPIMFSFFNGEVWDYIGSSKMVYDMERGEFPYASTFKNPFPTTSNDPNKAVLSKMNLSNIGYYLELNQVGLSDEGSLWMHSDPISKRDTAVQRKIKIITDTLKKAADAVNLPIKAVPDNIDQPLPPASLQRFLMKNNKIPGVVVTDHQSNYTNRFYNSRFDNPANINMNMTHVNDSFTTLTVQQPEHLAKLGKAVATTLYMLASDGVPPPEPLEVSANVTANLVFCFLYSALCPAFLEVLPRNQGRKSLKNLPLSRYVSVAQVSNPITTMVYSLLAYYTGTVANMSDPSHCTDAADMPSVFSYRFAKGNGPEDVCINYTVYQTPAVSPAFELKDYTSVEFSTWAESMWNVDIGVRMFLIQDPAQEIAILITGIVIFLISLVVAYVFFTRAEMIFSPPILSIN